jgi:hypothetical protein
MTPTQLRRAVAQLDFVRRRRELFFWTVTMTLTVILLVVMTLTFLVSLVQGGCIDGAHMAVGAGIAGLLRHLARLQAAYELVPRQTREHV